MSVLQLPPPSERGPVRPSATVSDSIQAGVRLVWLHRDLVEAIVDRHPGTLRPRSVLVQKVRTPLSDAVERPAVVPPTLVGSLAPYVTPRLRWLAPRLRRRLGRNRVELPLGRLREQDPTCLRINARRPGRTLIEKAGPRQRLLGVVRVERYDTTENRVLKAVATRLRARAAEVLRDVTGHASPRGRGLLSLIEACERVLDRPELAQVSAPRPGERPSNALLKDPHYRTLWRAWGLLRREEETFERAWNHLEILWNEAVLLSLWAKLDARADLEPLPEWCLGGALDEDEPVGWAWAGTHGDAWSARRSWIQHDADPSVVVARLGAEGVELERRPLRGAPVLHRVPARAEGLDGAAWLLEASRERARSLASAAIRAVGLESADPAEIPLATSRGPVGIDGCGLRMIHASAGGVIVGEPMARVIVRAPDASQHPIVGRPATWAADADLGILDESGPRVLGACAAAIDAAPLAVVVPGTWFDLQLAELRKELGPCWAVPRVVAALLGIELDGLPASVDEPDEPILVIVQGVDGVELAVVEASWSAPSVEDARRGGPRLPGLEWRRRRPSELCKSDEQLNGGGLRGDHLAFDGEHLVDEVARIPAFDPLEVQRLAGQLGTGCRRAVVLGDPALAAAVAGALPQVEVIEAPFDSAARGALRFLALYEERRPTWADLLPRLEAELRSDGMSKWVPLWTADRLVRPGERVDGHAGVEPVLPRGSARVAVPMRRREPNLDYALVVEGPPLPLERDTQFSVELDIEWGRTGLAGRFVPRSQRGLAAMPFRLEPSEALAESASTIELPPQSRPTVAQLQAIEGFVSSVKKPARSGKSKRKGNGKGATDPRWLAAKELADALEAWDGPGLEPKHVSLARRAAVVLDWLLELKTSNREERALLRKMGRPPNDGAKNPDVHRARRLLGGATDGLRVALTKGPRDWRDGQFAEWARMVGCTSGPTVDDVLRALIEAEPSSHHDIGAWALGLREAIQRNRELLASPAFDVDKIAAQVAHLWPLVVQGKPEQQKRPVARLAALVIWLCAARKDREVLPLDGAVVQDLVGRLARAMDPHGPDRLDPIVLDHFERGSPFRKHHATSIAIRWLEGRYTPLSGDSTC